MAGLNDVLGKIVEESLRADVEMLKCWPMVCRAARDVVEQMLPGVVRRQLNGRLSGDVEVFCRYLDRRIVDHGRLNMWECVEITSCPALSIHIRMYRKFYSVYPYGLTIDAGDERVTFDMCYGGALIANHARTTRSLSTTLRLFPGLVHNIALKSVNN